MNCRLMISAYCTWHRCIRVHVALWFSYHFLQVRRLNPIALRKAKIVHNFGLSECNRVNVCGTVFAFLVNELGQLGEVAGGWVR